LRRRSIPIHGLILTVTSEYWCTWNVTGVVCDNIIPKCIGGLKCWAGSVYSCYGCNCSSCPKYSTGASGCHGYLYQSTCGGTYCANSGVPAPYLQYIPTYNCHYISSVNSWTSCVGGVQWAASVTWSTVAGTSCSNVALSQSCVPPVPVVDIKANGSDNPIPIDYNTAAVISWTSTNADSCLVTPSGWTEINNPGVSSGNLTATTTYTLTCVNSYGTSTPDSVTICVSNCSCASSTCVGDTCSDGCGGNCAGTMPNTCSSWGSCSKDCGGGIQTKSCFCPSRTETQSCNAQPCSSGYREVTPW